jgi:hypothetical protein
LKQETQNANAQRFEALKEIEKLKDELSKQKHDEELRRKYVYDVIADEHSKTNVFTETHLPDVQIEKVVLPLQNEKNIYYDERLRHPNRIIPVPKLTELNENGMKTDSKFIDLDTHNVISGLELYEPNKNEDVNDKEINHKGFSIDGDYGTLRSYYHNNNSNDEFNNKLELSESNELNNNNNFYDENNNNNNNNFQRDVNKNIENNVKIIDNENLEVNKIYNKNMDRIRFLNEIEGKINGEYNYGNFNNNKNGNTLEEINKNLLNNKENFDDFINKINETCK